MKNKLDLMPGCAGDIETILALMKQAEARSKMTPKSFARRYLGGDSNFVLRLTSGRVSPRIMVARFNTLRDYLGEA